MNKVRFFNRALKSSSYGLVSVSLLVEVVAVWVTLLSAVELKLQDAARISQTRWMSLAFGRAC